MKVKERKEKLKVKKCGYQKLITVGTATQSSRSKEEKDTVQVPYKIPLHEIRSVVFSK